MTNFLFNPHNCIQIRTSNKMKCVRHPGRQQYNVYKSSRCSLRSLRSSVKLNTQNEPNRSNLDEIVPSQELFNNKLKSQKGHFRSLSVRFTEPRKNDTYVSNGPNMPERSTFVLNHAPDTTDSVSYKNGSYLHTPCSPDSLSAARSTSGNELTVKKQHPLQAVKVTI